MIRDGSSFPPQHIDGSCGPALLLADDLTGACDSGLAFARAGFSVSVLLETGDRKMSTSRDANFRTLTALSTDTRNLTADEATQRLIEVAQLRNFEGPLLFHKVDSAGRGQPAAEMRTIARLAGCEGVVYAPAFPENGRTVHDGILSVHDICRQNTDISLLSLFDQSAHAMIARIATAPDDATMQRRLLEARNRGKSIWLCDAERQEDLERIARAASSLGRRLLWSGSGGLAAAVAALFKAENFRRMEAPTTVPGCMLVVCGTPHPVTQMQVKQLASEAVTLALDGEARLEPGRCGLLELTLGASDEEAVRFLWARLHRGRSGPVSALVLTGGDTAAFFLKALGTTEIVLGGEVEAGIPWGIVQDGAARGCLTVTKSGGFGTELTLKHIVEFCRKVQG